MDDLLPNPCSTTVQHAESLAPYTFNKTSCDLPTDENDNTITSEIFVRTASAIRFRNPGMTFHLVDPVTSGDLKCHGDRLGTRRAFPTMYPGYQLTFNVTGGVAPMFVGTLDTTGVRQRVIVAFPAVIAPVPDGTLWILDQGDVLIASDPTRGRIVSINPRSAATTFDQQALR